MFGAFANPTVDLPQGGGPARPPARFAGRSPAF
jgi:hypothetical protein